MTLKKNSQGQKLNISNQSLYLSRGLGSAVSFPWRLVFGESLNWYPCSTNMSSSMPGSAQRPPKPLLENLRIHFVLEASQPPMAPVPAILGFAQR